jgi:hypothetical protein
MPHEIHDRREVQELMRKGAQVAEVLPREEFEEDHLPGAIHLPLDRIETEGGSTRAGPSSRTAGTRPETGRTSRVAAREPAILRGLRLRRRQARLARGRAPHRGHERTASAGRGRRTDAGTPWSSTMWTWVISTRPASSRR